MPGVQVDTKKVVSGLAVCTEDVHHCEKDKCPYWEKDHCEYELMSDAFNLIMELVPMVPHVMTLEEALASDECWFEHKNGACGYAEIIPCAYEDLLMVYRLAASPTIVESSENGKTWRCWSHQPTVEQRKEAKWDAM